MSQPASAPDPCSFRFAFRVVASSIGVIALLIASAGIPRAVSRDPTLAERALVFLGLCLGPATGWILALGQGDVARALPMLVTMSVLCLGPLIVALVHRSAAALAVSALFWLISGYLSSIAVRG